MSPGVRTALWAHSIASWAAFGVLWIDVLRQPGRPPLDGRFWLIFGVTEGLAPIWLPLSFIVYQPVLTLATAMIAAVYVPVAIGTAAWRWHFEKRRLAADRRAAGQCAGCGYDLRASAGLCPECGAEPTAGVHAST